MIYIFLNSVAAHYSIPLGWNWQGLMAHLEFSQYFFQKQINTYSALFTLKRLILGFCVHTSMKSVH